MGKQIWKPGNMLYPVPAVMVSCADRAGRTNIITVAWAGTVCTNPPMLSISVRPERFSYGLLRDSGEFAVNLVGRSLARACDWCGVKSGRDVDKWAEMGLTPEPAETLEHAPVIAESPVNIECAVRDVLELGSHHLFLAEVRAVRVDERLIDEAGKLHLERANLVAYSHGEYFDLGRSLGTFGYSVRKKPAAAPKRQGKGERPGSTGHGRPENGSKRNGTRSEKGRERGGKGRPKR